jgi:hypothetical protein
MSIYIGPPLRRIEVGETHGWDAFQAQQLGGLDPTMARDDLASLRHADGG